MAASDNYIFIYLLFSRYGNPSYNKEYLPDAQGGKKKSYNWRVEKISYIFPKLIRVHGLREEVCRDRVPLYNSSRIEGQPVK